MKKILFLLLFVSIEITLLCQPFLQKIKKDAVTPIDDQYSVVFWRIKITDKTGLLGKQNTMYFTPDIQLCKYGQESISEYIGPLLNYSSWGLKILEGGWYTKDGFSCFDEMVYARIMPGDYYFSRIKFFLKDTTKADYFLKYKLVTTTYLNTPIDKFCNIPAKSMVYIGEIHLEVLRDENNPFNINIIQTEESFKRNIQLLQSSFPKIYEHFQENIITSSLSYYLHEGFQYDENFRGWDPSTGYLIGSSKCRCNHFNLNCSDNNSYKATITNNFAPLPTNFNIVLKTEWLEGVNNKGYGLILGKNDGNFHCFCITANGYAVIHQKEDNTWTTDPINWQKDMAKIGGCGIINDLRIEVRENKFIYFVNNNKIGEIENILYPDKVRIIGLMVNGQQIVCFKELIIEEIGK